MQKVKIIRAFSNNLVTLGMLQIQGIYHQPIYTLENPDRITDVDDVIDPGMYICKPHFGTKYKNVWKIHDVPRREDILIHWGNVEKHTLGCILVGLGAGQLNGQPAVLNSKRAIALMRKLIGMKSFHLTIV